MLCFAVAKTGNIQATASTDALDVSLYDSIPSNETLSVESDQVKAQLTNDSVQASDKLEIIDSISSKNHNEQSTDTLETSSYDLEELVVVGAREARLRDGMAYYPDKNQTKFATDGVSLLARMMIPTLRVNMMKNSVETISQEAVSFFINGLEASAEDIAALVPADVNKVEVLKRPSEAKYFGAKNVINFVVTKYLWGGYTKVSGNVAGPAWRSGAYANSRLTYKKMTYSVYLGSNYNQNFTNSKSTDNLDVDGTPCSITTVNNRPKGRTTSETGYFTALYQTEKVSVRNRLSLSHGLTPWQTGNGLITYRTPSEILEALSKSGTHSNRFTPAWDGNLNIIFPHNASLALSASTLFRLNNSSHNQEEYDSGNLIFNNDYRVKETGNVSSLTISFNKIFQNNHFMSIQAFGYRNSYKLDYEGTVAQDTHLTDVNAFLNAAYTYFWKSGRVSPFVRLSYTCSDFEGAKKKDIKWLPEGGLYLMWNPGSNKQVSANLYYLRATYPLAQINETRIQKNLWLWEEGNPNMDISSAFGYKFNYQWWNTKFAFNVFMDGQYESNTAYQTAYQNQDGAGLTLSYNDNVSWGLYNIGAYATWFISNEFSITGGGTVVSMNKSAPVNAHRVAVQGQLQGQWSHKNYSVFFSVASPFKTESFMGFGTYYPDYGIGASAVYGNWVISLNVNNPFNSKKSYEDWGHTPNHLYSFRNLQYSRLSTTDIKLSATYTIRYGRKQVDQNIETVTSDQSLMK